MRDFGLLQKARGTHTLRPPSSSSFSSISSSSLLLLAPHPELDVSSMLSNAWGFSFYILTYCYL